MKIISETCTNLDIYVFFYYYWVDTYADGRLVPDGIIAQQLVFWHL
jgi:hypothetical protein